MLRVNYKHKKCYNSVLVVKSQSESHIRDNDYELIKTSFYENKEYNFLELNLEPGRYFVIVYNSHPQEVNLSYNLTLFSSEEFIEMVSFSIKADILFILEHTFKAYLNQMNSESGQQVTCKHLYQQTGMAFIFAKPRLSPLKVKINKTILA